MSTGIIAETLATAEDLIATYIDIDKPVWLEGPPGVGKSQLWAQIAKKRGWGFIDLRLAQLDPVDLRGLPKHEAKKINGKDEWTTIWTMSDMWPQHERDGKRGIILLDEMADTTRAMQTAAYQVVLDRAIGTHKIADGWYIAAAGNRRKDKAAAQQVSSALASRFAWIEVSADPDCFVKYGRSKGFHHYVTGFIQFRPVLVHKMPEGGEIKAFPCPRQYEGVSNVCHALEKRHGLTSDGAINMRKSDLIRYVGALIGSGAAGEFASYVEGLKLPSFDEIIKNPKKAMIPDAPASRYALSGLLSYKADEKTFPAIWEYISRGDFGRDFEIATVLTATERDQSLCDTDTFTKFARKNQDLTL